MIQSQQKNCAGLGMQFVVYIKDYCASLCQPRKIRGNPDQIGVKCDQIGGSSLVRLDVVELEGFDFCGQQWVFFEVLIFFD